jgi:chaperonin GroEL (HSP60 family)
MTSFSKENYNAMSILETVRMVARKVKEEKDLSKVRKMVLSCGPVNVEGVPFDVSEHQQIHYISIFCSRMESTEPEVSVIPLTQVTALRIPFHEFYKDILIKPGPWNMNLSDAPSKLNLERSVKEFGQRYSKDASIQWNGEEADAGARMYIHKLVTSAEKQLQLLMEDSFGKEALDQLKEVVFTFDRASSESVEVKEKSLLFTIGESAEVNTLDSKLNKLLNSKL